MLVEEFQHSELTESGTTFEPIKMQQTNILVGASASGKSRFLNAFSLEPYSPGGNPDPSKILSSKYYYAFSIEEIKYTWNIEIESKNNGELEVIKEIIECDRGCGSPEKLIDRNKEQFKFKNTDMPKLQKDKSAITIFKDDEALTPIYNAFGLFMRRDFASSSQQPAMDFSLPAHLSSKSSKAPSFQDLFKLSDIPPNVKLEIIQKSFGSTFNQICKLFCEIFPFVERCSIQDLNVIAKKQIAPEYVPAFCIEEKGIKGQLPIQHCASGMKKVLIILMDLLILQEGSIYLIDEYENSLGINAIDFLPTFLSDYDRNIQLLVTTHHPYIINQIPISQWKLFSRLGKTIKVTDGAILAQEYGKSKQEHFTLLINDERYRNGIQ